LRLALACGRLDVENLLDEITPAQMDEWIAYAMVEPLPDPWRQTGLLAAILMNASQAPTETRVWQAEDFVPAAVKTQNTLRPDKLPVGSQAVQAMLRAQVLGAAS
jgi:hypothetical protein